MREAMKYTTHLLLLAALLLCPAMLSAQSEELKPAERSEMVSTALRMRVRWLEDHLKVDPCSVAAATGDTAFMSRMDPRVQHLFLDLPFTPGCKPVSLELGGRFVQVISVRGVPGAVMVRMLVRGVGIGTLPQEYRLSAGRWTIQIEPPSATSDASSPLDPVPRRPPER
jgi:hypothetical protein